MKRLHLNLTIEKLKGPTKSQLITQNQWAAVALDLFHKDSKGLLTLSVDGSIYGVEIAWDSTFSKAAMKEKTEMANQGGVAFAMFIMSVLLDYKYVEQTEIGTGVDYRFFKEPPEADDLNFLNDYHYVEISGILEENKSNTLKNRIASKHKQIEKGNLKAHNSSVLVTLFSEIKSTKETYNGSTKVA